MGKKKIDELKGVPSKEKTSKEKIADLKQILALAKKIEANLLKSRERRNNENK